MMMSRSVIIAVVMAAAKTAPHRICTYFREHNKFQNPLLPDTCWSQYLFYVWKGFA